MTLVLLHGLGANREVWRDVLALAPDAIAIDLAGHGSAARLSSYTFEAYADAVLPQLPAGPVDLLGHSMGGMVALVVAARHPEVRKVAAFGVKVAWSDVDVAGAAAQAARPAGRWPTREEAVERYLRFSGLSGLVALDHPTVASGVEEYDDHWQLTQDPRTFGFGRPDFASLLEQCPCPVTLARGEHDQMVTTADLAQVVTAHVTLPGLGHNAHVEDPRAVLSLPD